VGRPLTSNRVRVVAVLPVRRKRRLFPAPDCTQTSAGQGAAPERETPTDEALATSMRPSNTNSALRTGHERTPAWSNESSIACNERLRPYRHLAMHVLARAVRDVLEPARSATDRESARAFLAGSVMLQHWCRVAALNPDCVAEHVERFTAGLTVKPPGRPAGRTLRHSEIL
jgi:hypothetical protein